MTVPDPLKTQLTVLQASASTQTTHGFALLTVAAVLIGTIVRLGQAGESNEPLLVGALCCGILAVSWAGWLLSRRLDPPPWPYGTAGDFGELERYVADMTALVAKRADFVQTGTLLLGGSGTLTLLAAITPPI